MSAGAALRRLVVTDLDGSLLDHHNYDYAPAEPVMAALEASGIPLARHAPRSGRCAMRLAIAIPTSWKMAPR